MFEPVYYIRYHVDSLPTVPAGLAAATSHRQIPSDLHPVPQ